MTLKYSTRPIQQFVSAAAAELAASQGWICVSFIVVDPALGDTEAQDMLAPLGSEMPQRALSDIKGSVLPWKSAWAASKVVNWTIVDEEYTGAFIS